MRVYNIKSEALGQDIKVFVNDFGQQSVMTSDGVAYTAQEVEMLKKSGKPVPKELHVIKKAFNGTLIYHERKFTYGRQVDPT